MVDVIKNNLSEIIQTCNTMQVKYLYLFGSGARVTDYSENSDLDFLFEYIKTEAGLPVSGFDYFDLLWKLEKITGKKVDLVSDGRIRNKYLVQSILEDRIKLYEA